MIVEASLAGVVLGVIVVVIFVLVILWLIEVARH